MKARPDQQKTSKAHKSIADIIAKAAGKIDKTRTKQQNPNVEVKPSKRETMSTFFCFHTYCLTVTSIHSDVQAEDVCRAKGSSREASE